MYYITIYDINRWRNILPCWLLITVLRRACQAYLAPVVLNIFRACCIENHLFLQTLTFILSETKSREKMCAQFFLPIDQTADRSIWHQGYWSLRPSIAGRFQMQMCLNNNLWQHTNSLTNCRQTFYKHSDSMRKWFFFFSTFRPFKFGRRALAVRQTVSTVCSRLKI